MVPSDLFLKGMNLVHRVVLKASGGRLGWKAMKMPVLELTTTGRKRRCGWFDAVAARYAARLNTVTELVVTKLDVLSHFDTIPICIAYEYEGERYEDFPPHQTIFNKCRPVFEELPGWREDIRSARRVDDLPKEARALLERFEELSGAPVSWASVGPGREEIVPMHEGIA